jgi:hypothetical protein
VAGPGEVDGGGGVGLANEQALARPLLRMAGGWFGGDALTARRPSASAQIMYSGVLVEIGRLLPAFTALGSASVPSLIVT